MDDDDAGCGKSACELRWLEILSGFIRDFFECTLQPKKAGQTAAAAAKAWKRPACEMWSAICGAEIVAAHAATYPSRASEYGPYMREFLAMGARVTPQQLTEARKRREAFTAKFTAVLESVDAIGGPSGGDPAWPITHAIQVGSLPEYHKAWSQAAPRSAEFTIRWIWPACPRSACRAAFLRTVCRTASSLLADGSASRCCAASPMRMSKRRNGIPITRT